jgi:hypothetical protein
MTIIRKHKMKSWKTVLIATSMLTLASGIAESNIFTKELSFLQTEYQNRYVDDDSLPSEGEQVIEDLGNDVYLDKFLDQFTESLYGGMDSEDDVLGEFDTYLEEIVLGSDEFADNSQAQPYRSFSTANEEDLAPTRRQGQRFESDWEDELWPDWGGEDSFQMTPPYKDRSRIDYMAP